MRSLLLAVLCLVPALSHAASGSTELTWYGHAAFSVKTPTGKVLLIDPWITNPANAGGAKSLAAIDKADLILVSHGHADHVGNAVELGKKTGAKLVSTFDLGQALVAAGYPANQMGFDTQGNAGGTIELLGGEVTITFVPAVHGSQVQLPGAGGAPGQVIPAGSAGGFLIKIKNGPTLYHTGDTDLFGDMARLNAPVDVMLACIGDHFTMGPERAAEAVKMVHPKRVVPMHYGTFPVLTGTPEAFGAALKKNGVNAQMVVMKMNEPMKF